MMCEKLLSLIFMVVFSLSSVAQEPLDSDRLEMAIAYFQSGKYHEALLLFEKLDKEYSLNPRFQGFMGVCYYHEWLYEEACKKLDAVMPQLEVFAPHERSVYYYTAGESHFELKQYAKAVPYFEKALTVCYDNEKGDICYRLGMCYMFMENWSSAYEQFEKALDFLIGFRDIPEMQARIKQTAHMMAGCKNRMKEVDKHTSSIAAVSDDIPTSYNADSLDVVVMTPDLSSSRIDTAQEDLLETEKENVEPIKPSQVIVEPSVPMELNLLPKKPIQVIVTEKVARRVVKTQKEDPSTKNIDHIYEQKVEVKE